LRLSRARGYASSSGEVVPSLQSVAVPLTLPGQPPASIAVIHVALTGPEDEIARRLQAGVGSVVRAYGS
jgi:DNA-binding IclR family transcriptional regulator